MKTKDEAEREFEAAVKWAEENGGRRIYAQSYRTFLYEGELVLAPTDGSSHPYLPFDYYSCPDCGRAFGHHKTKTCLVCERCAPCCDCERSIRLMKDRMDTFDWASHRM